MTADPKYGDGLVFIVDDSLNMNLWLDERWVGEVRLDRLDDFLSLRKLLHDVDDVAVLTKAEADEVAESIAEATRD